MSAKVRSLELIVKKVFVTILAVIYLATTTGATLHMHYCMGKVFSVDFVKKDGCSKCGMKTSEDCCKDELKVLKVNDNHQQTNSVVDISPAYAIVDRHYLEAEPAFTDAAAVSAIHNNSPPNASGASLCILHCVFRL